MLKSNIAWMKKNVPSDLKVWKGMIQDIDWSQVAAKTKLSLQRDKDRITAEFKEFAAMDTSAKIDWLMNGDPSVICIRKTPSRLPAVSGRASRASATTLSAG